MLPRALLLLFSGAFVCAAGDAALLQAALSGSPADVRRLLARGADPNQSGKDGLTPLMLAAGDLAKVRLLVGKGADVNARSAAGRTALMLASAYDGNSATVKLLLDHGADPKAQDSTGGTALLLAARAGDAASVKLLLGKGADGNARAGSGYGRILFGASSLAFNRENRPAVGPTPLMMAAVGGDLETVRVLLDHGADARAKSPFGYSTLHLAADRGNPELVRLLLEHGADVNGIDYEGHTPLILAAAAERVNPDVVRLLLERGADPRVKGKDGLTALDWAAKKGETPVVRLLRVSAATPDVRRSVEKSLDLMLSSGTQFTRKTACISCHHQSLAAMAVSLARLRGLRVNEAVAREQTLFTAAIFAPHRTNLLQAIDSVPDVPTVAAYALLGLAGEKYPAHATTEAMVHDIARWQRADGRWHGTDRRPPLGYSDYSATALSLRSLQLYGMPGRKREFDQRVARARAWLLAQSPRATEDRAFHLLGLGWSGAERASRRTAAVALAAEQRTDGGWAQLEWLPASDAYATGQALMALHQAGGMPVSDPVYRRGVEYLLRTRLEDGSWHVRTRAMGFQPYFESGFPHGPDQWISAAATAWSAMALALTVPPR
jgi:ankyrin repeat protein